ncbi:uncharacterized protein BJ212DRAFT_1305297 [Suillus subaureus]|uniref:Uncharacterized protein n=1 Tax=Suillus subaureus TaxID=48587 RepID=A0A9P7DQF3_9AGAM|nr:uncharacterized protein BJ212DRAFT_1305297 [Suillus subaureus]KAG1800508.1 hypothetical protein BJ212DRAFT_1305297 [Suillus subaureus]
MGTRQLATSTTYPKRHELIDQPERTAIETLPSIMCKGISQEQDEPLEDMCKHIGCQMLVQQMEWPVARDIAQVKNCAKLPVAGRVFLQELKGKILVVWNFRAVELHRIVKKEQNRWIAQELSLGERELLNCKNCSIVSNKTSCAAESMAFGKNNAPAEIGGHG